MNTWIGPLMSWPDAVQYRWWWTPYGVSPEWRPYTIGARAESDAGWTWTSNADGTAEQRRSG